MDDPLDILCVPLFGFACSNFFAYLLLAFWIVLLQQFNIETEFVVYCSAVVWSIFIVSPPIIERLYRRDKNWKALFACGLSTIISTCTIGSTPVYECSLIAFAVFLAVHFGIGYLSLKTPQTVENSTILILDLFRMIMGLIVSQMGFAMQCDVSFVADKIPFWYLRVFFFVHYIFMCGFTYLLGFANLYLLEDSLENRKIPQVLEHVPETRHKSIDLFSLKVEELNIALNQCEKLRRELEGMV